MDPYLSYAAKNGFEVVDWAAVIASGLDGTLSDEDHKKYVNLAAKWSTCAVGQTSHLIPRWPTFHTPKANVSDCGTLIRVGCKFCGAIENKDFERANEYLNEVRNFEKEFVSNHFYEILI